MKPYLTNKIIFPLGSYILQDIIIITTIIISSHSSMIKSGQRFAVQLSTWPALSIYQLSTKTMSDYLQRAFQSNWWHCHTIGRSQINHREEKFEMVWTHYNSIQPYHCHPTRYHLRQIKKRQTEKKMDLTNLAANP